MQYTTLENLKDYLWITCDDQDADLQSLIRRWSDMLSTELWDDLWLKTVTRRYDGYWSNRVVLESIINTVSLVEYTTNNWYSRNPVEVDFVEWYVIYTRSSLPKGFKNVRVTYQKWYAKVPGDIETFFLKYVSFMKSEKEVNSKSKEIKTKKFEDLSITYFWPNELSSRNSQFAQDYEAIKNKYKVFSFQVTQ